MESPDLGNVEIKFLFRRPAPKADTAEPATLPAGVQTGKLPRITQILALAIQFEEMVRNGEARNYSDLARLGCLTRERVSQIMKLRWLAPDIQTEVLRLSPTTRGRSPIREVDLRTIAHRQGWREQRELWRRLTT